MRLWISGFDVVVTSSTVGHVPFIYRLQPLAHRGASSKLTSAGVGAGVCVLSSSSSNRVFKTTDRLTHASSNVVVFTPSTFDSSGNGHGPG